MTTVLVRTTSPFDKRTLYGRESQSSRTARRAIAISAPNFSAWLMARPASACPEIPVGNPR
jgi:hypothetical protein